jgi:hypothetical protein
MAVLLLVDVFSHREKVKMVVRIVKNVVLFFAIWENPGHLTSRTEFCGTQGYSYLKPVKPGTSRENWEE